MPTLDSLVEAINALRTHMDDRFEAIEIKLSGIPLLGPLMRDLRGDVRQVDNKLRALRVDIQDINDRGRHISPGAIAVLNEDISGLKDDNREIRARLALLEQKAT